MSIVGLGAVARSVLLIGLLLGLGKVASGQQDPGPRTGAAAAGGPIVGLSANEEKMFWAAWQRFKEVSSVSGTIERGVGLGPTFNGNSCAQCHAQPAAGGSSPGAMSPQVRRVVMTNQRMVLTPQPNPQVELASLDRLPGRNQIIPSFITPDGPIRVPRFIRKSDGKPDGEVHPVYTVEGRVDAPGCVLPQPDFVKEMKNRNVVFRIPTPTFGGGLIEAIQDATLIINLEITVERRRVLGIGGRFNRSAEDGTITRFGWKAQNKSLLFFAAESFSVEMGVTNEGFPNERNQTADCIFNALPEDRTRIQSGPDQAYLPSAFASDVVNAAAFMRLSAAPIPSTHAPSEINGRELFSEIGCSLCHSSTLKTGSSPFASMSQLDIHPYSDFALHHMGPGLADHISQGLASGDEFRTVPLWGIGQRMFFLHDGRTNDLLVAIREHASASKTCPAGGSTNRGEACRSEANSVIQRFQDLTPTQKQDILNFLRSL